MLSEGEACLESSKPGFSVIIHRHCQRFRAVAFSLYEILRRKTSLGQLENSFQNKDDSVKEMSQYIQNIESFLTSLGIHFFIRTELCLFFSYMSPNSARQ